MYLYYIRFNKRLGYVALLKFVVFINKRDMIN